MSAAASVFDFRFKIDDLDEGRQLVTAIGVDMVATEGYMRHDVINDIADPAHFVVITFWHEQAQGEAVLGSYAKDAKVSRAAELIGAEPSGFLGRVD